MRGVFALVASASAALAAGAAPLLGADVLAAAAAALAPGRAGGARFAEAVAPPAHIAPRDPPPGGWPNWTATWIFPNSTLVQDATCLDGSPPLYYVSPGFGDGAAKWQIHHVGGAWCSDAQGCMNWWGWVDTLTFPATMPAYNAATSSYAYFDRTAPTNSMWNVRTTQTTSGRCRPEDAN